MGKQTVFFARGKRGFTLIELVMVLILVGILAVAVIPRFAQRDTFDTRGFFDQSIAMLRYAQKTAIAQGRNVFVNINPTVICLTYVADASCSASSTADQVLNPATNTWFTKSAPSGASLGVAQSFSFTALGRPNPNNSVSLAMSGAGISQTIVVERDTGYVH